MKFAISNFARIPMAGCVGYFSALPAGATYHGRMIDDYVEWFPGARP